LPPCWIVVSAPDFRTGSTTTVSLTFSRRGATYLSLSHAQRDASRGERGRWQFVNYGVTYSRRIYLPSGAPSLWFKTILPSSSEAGRRLTHPRMRRLSTICSGEFGSIPSLAHPPDVRRWARDIPCSLPRCRAVRTLQDRRGMTSRCDGPPAVHIVKHDGN
jgi:hypothetical protein